MYHPRLFALIAIVSACFPLYSATVYNEAVAGDLSNNGLTPTVLTVTPGSNQIIGTTGRGTAGTDRDYFTITIPAGYELGHIIELPGTQVGDAVSFIGLEAGPQLTLAPTVTTAAGLLGWTHYGPTNVAVDLLPAMRIPDTGSSGFSVLPAGAYSFWIQDFGAGTSAYSFDLQVTPTPEPATFVPAAGGLALLGVALWRRTSKGYAKG